MVNVFVALAAPVGAGRSLPTVICLHPAAPFANVGFHQEAEREVDIDYCRSSGIPLVRRVVGGGAILDGPWEQDFMVVVPQGASGTDRGVAGFYDCYLAPIRSTLERLGVPTERSGINDLASQGRKVSANGALTLQGSWILTGDILLDVDAEAMSRVLKVPDAKFRDKLAGSMAEWLTSVRARTGRLPPRHEVTKILAEEFSRSLSVRFEPGVLSREEAAALAELRETRTKDEWTFQKERGHPNLRGGPTEGRAVKISNEATLARFDRKAGKLVRVTLLHRQGRIDEVEFSGDFFTVPFDGRLAQLEAALSGIPLSEDEVGRAIGEWFCREQVQLIGATAEDLTRALLEAAALAPSSS
jgi:lipoate-protein ligase A